MDSDSKTQKIKKALTSMAVYPMAAVHYVLSPISYLPARFAMGNIGLNKYANLGFDAANEIVNSNRSSHGVAPVSEIEMNALVAHINRCQRVSYTTKLKTLNGHIAYKIKLDNTCEIRGLCDMTGHSPELIAGIHPCTARIFVDGAALGDSASMEIVDMNTLHKYIRPAIMNVYNRMPTAEKLSVAEHAVKITKINQKRWLDACAANSR